MQANGAVGCLARMPLPTFGALDRPTAEQPQAASPSDNGLPAEAAAGGSLATRVR